MSTVFIEGKLCQTCGAVKEVTEFRKEDIHCKECRKSKDRDTRLAKKEKDRRTAFATLVSGIRGNRIEVPHTSEVAAEMMRLYGGLSQFCSEWKQDIDAMRVDRPGSKSVIDSKMAIVKLIIESTNQRDSAPDLAGMTDEELETELTGMITILLVKNPKLLKDMMSVEVEKPKIEAEVGSKRRTEEPDSPSNGREKP